MDWVSGRLHVNDVPRVQDVYEYSRAMGLGLTRRTIAKELRLHQAYMLNMPQQREKFRHQKHRPIITHQLGQLHADIGYFSVTRDYETPKSFRHGYLVTRDVLSRFVSVVILRYGKSADAMVRAFEELLHQHKNVHPEYNIMSVAFDRETSVLSHKVQNFFKEHHIKFHAFQMSASKAKGAESAIKQIRTVMARLEREHFPQGRWWKLLQPCVDIINARPILIDGKNTGFSPQDITLDNLEAFKKKLIKSAPSYFFSQYEIAPALVDFRYEVGDLVRPKLLATSSDVIGVKTSQVNLKTEVFEIVKKVPYVTRRMTIGKAYKCKDIKTGRVEVFDEHDVALSKLDYIRGENRK